MRRYIDEYFEAPEEQTLAPSPEELKEIVLRKHNEGMTTSEIVMDVRYLPNTDEIEITTYYGYPRYIPMSDLEMVDANERAYGVETEYRTSDGIHIFFYPEGKLSGWYDEKK